MLTEKAACITNVFDKMRMKSDSWREDREESEKRLKNRKSIKNAFPAPIDEYVPGTLHHHMVITILSYVCIPVAWVLSLTHLCTLIQ